MEDKKKWLYVSMANLVDIDGQISLNMGISSSCDLDKLSEFSFDFTKLFIQIVDNRIKNNTRLSMSLGYQDIFYLVSEFKRITKDGKTYNNSLDFNKKVHIIKNSYNKSYKKLQIEFGKINNNPVISINIEDKTSSAVKLNINLTERDFGCFFELLKNTLSNFTKLSMDMRVVCNQEILFNKINYINLFLKEKSDQIISTMSRQTIDCQKQNVITENEEFNNIDFDYTDDNNSIEENSTDYLTQFKMDIDLDSELSDKSKMLLTDDSEENNKSIKSNNQFIETFLNYDISSIDRYRDMFALCGDKSDDMLFKPHSKIMSLCGVNKSVIDNLENIPDYFKSQYYILSCLKNNILKFTKESKFDKFKIVCFPETINSNEIDNIIKCSSVCLILYNYVLSIFSNINNPIGSIDSFHLSREFIKIVLGPFILSIKNKLVDEESKNKFIEELWEIYSSLEKTNSLDKMKDSYSKLTLNGKYNINYTIFSKEAYKLINFLPKIEYITYKELDDELSKLNISINSDVNSINDVKDRICSILQKDEDNKIDQSILNFLKYTKNIIEEKLYNQILDICVTYDDLTNVINSYDIPEEVMRIKKAFDNNRNIDSKSTLNKELDKLKSNNEENEEESTVDDWNNILFGIQIQD